MHCDTASTVLRESSLHAYHDSTWLNRVKLLTWQVNLCSISMIEALSCGCNAFYIHMLHITTCSMWGTNRGEGMSGSPSRTAVSSLDF